MTMHRLLARLLGALVLAGLGACSPSAPPPSPTVGASGPRPLTAEEAELMARLPKDVTQGNHSWVMDAILGKPKRVIRTVGILVYDGVNDLDAMGPRYVLGQTGAKARLISVKPGPIKTVMGVQLLPDATIDEVQQLDILVVPGGFTGTVEAAYDPKVLGWIRAID